MASGLKYVGSFQSGTRLQSENPLEEVWAYVDRLSSSEFIKSVWSAQTPQDVERLAKYSALRVRQAVQFRNSSRHGDILTAPLTLYYSFLNLMRAVYCMRTDRPPASRHGLQFVAGRDLLSSSSTLCSGTFRDYLSFVAGGREPAPLSISLREALAHIAEIRGDFCVFADDQSASSMIAVQVQAEINGAIKIHFPNTLPNFASTWETEFPTLKGVCALDGDFTLRVTSGASGSSYDAVRSFCAAHLEPHLLSLDYGGWFLRRQTDPRFDLPRAAFYFVALFILGSVVRYEPELMLMAIDPEAQLRWLIKRALQAAERFYPQLMLSWITGSPLYF